MAKNQNEEKEIRLQTKNTFNKNINLDVDISCLNNSRYQQYSHIGRFSYVHGKNLRNEFFSKQRSCTFQSSIRGQVVILL